MIVELLVLGGVLAVLAFVYAALAASLIAEPKHRIVGIVAMMLPWISAFLLALGLGWRL